MSPPWNRRPTFDDPDQVNPAWWSRQPPGYGLGIQFELPDGTWIQVRVDSPDQAELLFDEVDAQAAEVWGWVQVGERGWEDPDDVLDLFGFDPDDDPLPSTTDDDDDDEDPSW